MCLESSRHTCIYNNYVHITVAPAVASFTNPSCATGGVKSTVPLLFTCEVNGAALLRLVLPTGDQEITSIGDTAADISLPTGFTAVSLDITEIDDFTRNFNITISIANASLLGGGEIICDDTTSTNQARASCPIYGKFNSLSLWYKPVIISAETQVLMFCMLLSLIITGYGSTLYIGIAMVFVFSPYICKFTSCFQFQVNLTFNDVTAQNMSKVICVPNISLNYHFLAKL